MHDSRVCRYLDSVVFDRLASWRSPFPCAANSSDVYRKIGEDFKADDTLLAYSFGLFTALDSKTSALLTHISVLTAVVAVFFSGAPPHTYYRTVLAIELFAYLLSTILCLRCIRFALPSVTEQTSHADQAFEEIEKRRLILGLASDITICATATLVVLFVVHLIL